MSEESELPVPEESYTNIRKVVHNTDDNYLVVKTDNMMKDSSVNEDLLPEEVKEFSEHPSESYVGGVDELEIGAFSENIHEVLASISECRTNGHGYMSVSFDHNSEILPALRFREKHGKVKAVVTNRERL